MQAEKLVHQMERWSSAQADLGLSLFKLSKFEEMEGEALAAHTSSSLALAHMCGALRKAGTSAVRASRVARKATGASAIELAALHEFLAFTPVSAARVVLLYHVFPVFFISFFPLLFSLFFFFFFVVTTLPGTWTLAPSAHLVVTCLHQESVCGGMDK